LEQILKQYVRPKNGTLPVTLFNFCKLPYNNIGAQSVSCYKIYLSDKKHFEYRQWFYESRNP